MMNFRRRQEEKNENNSKQRLIVVDDNNQSEQEHHEESDLTGDRMNIGILFFLYLLQGIPLGLTAAIPMLMQNRGATYKQQVQSLFTILCFVF